MLPKGNNRVYFRYKENKTVPKNMEKTTEMEMFLWMTAFK